VKRPVFLDFAVVEEIHHASLEMYGGMPGIRDKNLIESALGSAQNTYYYARGDLFDIAATYASISRRPRRSSMGTSGQRRARPTFSSKPTESSVGQPILKRTPP
jgi:hypothetical protein